MKMLDGEASFRNNKLTRVAGVLLIMLVLGILLTSIVNSYERSTESYKRAMYIRMSQLKEEYERKLEELEKMGKSCYVENQKLLHKISVLQSEEKSCKARILQLEKLTAKKSNKTTAP